MRFTGRARASATVTIMIIAGAAGCGTSARHSASHRPAVTRSQETALPAPGSRCVHRKLRLRPGERVPAAYLAAIQFVSPASGVGVTESEISCLIGPGGGGSEHLTPWPVVSADGGRTWRASGSELPRWLQPGAAEARMAFSTARTGWLTAGGALAFTGDGGRRWERVNLGGQVEGLASSGSVRGVLVATPHGGIRVWRLAASSSRHSPLPPLPGPPPTASAYSVTGQSMAVLGQTGKLVLDVAGRATDRLVAIDPAGRHWVSLTEPCHPAAPGSDNDPLAGFQALVAAGGELGAVCGHGVGMMHATQSFLLSRDSGRTWRLRNAEQAFRPARHGMPFSSLLAAASPAPPVFYMATEAEADVSTDGGLRWRLIAAPGIPGNGADGAAFSFSGPRHGWLLLVGEGLLGTTDGIHWLPLGLTTG
jgi:hypothetical protein